MRLLVLLTSFFVVISGSLISNAQIGWQWASGSTHALAYGGFDEQAAAIDVSGNIFVAGYAWGDSATFGTHIVYNTDSSRPINIIKVDPSGSFQWATKAVCAYGDALGMVADAAGNVYLLGEYSGDSLVIGSIQLRNTHSYMCFLTKISSTGSVIWAKNIAGDPFLDGNRNMGIDAAGNLYVTTSFSSSDTSVTIGSTTLIPTGDYDVIMAKFDNAGNNIWAKIFGGSGFDVPGTIAVAPDGTFYISGQYTSPTLPIGPFTLSNIITSYTYMGFLARFDSSGHALWATNLNRDILVNQMALDRRNNAYLNGYTQDTVTMGAFTLSSFGNKDAFLAKYNSSGSLMWAKDLGGVNNDPGMSIVVDKCGKLFATISVNSGYPYSIVIDGHTVNTAPASDDPVFITAFDTSGVYDTTFQLASGGDDFSDLMLDGSGNLYLAADLSGSIYVGPIYLPDHSIYEEALYVAKYTYSLTTCSTTEVEPGPAANEMVICPNPAFGDVTFQSQEAVPEGSKAELYDLTGRVVATYYLSGTHTYGSLAGVSAGLYQCIITLPGKAAVMRKLVVEK